jgi:short-subunit dehydrogenase
MRLSGTTLLITGASRGVGRELAIHFAGAVRCLVLVARDKTKLEETADEARKHGAECYIVPTDLNDFVSIEALTTWLTTSEISVDILVNNAADVTSKPLSETTDEEVDALLRTNVGGPLALCRETAATMAANGAGYIINISSLAGYKANPHQTVYSISKTAVNAMSEALRAEYGGQGVRVMNVALMSVGPDPGQMSASAFADRLQRAIERDETELYLSSLTKWLMRLYHFYPPLARLRRPSH